MDRKTVWNLSKEYMELCIQGHALRPVLSEFYISLSLNNVIYKCLQTGKFLYDNSTSVIALDFEGLSI